MATSNLPNPYKLQLNKGLFFIDILTKSHHMTISKLVKFGLETRAVELKNQRSSDYDIAKCLTTESGKKISRENVHNYFRTQQKTLKALAAEDTEFHKEVLRQLLDANEQLLFVAREARAAIEEAKEDSESDPLRRAALLSVILHQVEILLKRAGEISDAPQTNIMVIKQEFNNFQQFALTIIEEEGGHELCERILRRIQKESG